MADINVEQKGRSIWPWIIGLIVLALIIWALVEMFGGDDEAAPVTTPADTVSMVDQTQTQTQTTTAMMPASIQQFVSECREPATDAQDQPMDLDHSHTADCLDQFADAAEEVSRRGTGVNVDSELEQIRQNANQLRESGVTPTTHANMVRDAFASGATVLDRLAQQNPGAGADQQVTQARQAAENVQPEVELLDQRDNVHDFFRHAGDALERMAGAGTGM